VQINRHFATLSQHAGKDDCTGKAPLHLESLDQQVARPVIIEGGDHALQGRRQIGTVGTIRMAGRRLTAQSHGTSRATSHFFLICRHRLATIPAQSAGCPAATQQTGHR